MDDELLIKNRQAGAILQDGLFTTLRREGK